MIWKRLSALRCADAGFRGLGVRDAARDARTSQGSFFIACVSDQRVRRCELGGVHSQAGPDLVCPYDPTRGVPVGSLAVSRTKAPLPATALGGERDRRECDPARAT